MRNKQRMSEAMKQRVQELRREATEAETVLWRLLRGRRFMGVKFRRQYPVRGYVLDFYCDEAKLGIELDGGEHLDMEQANYDEERSRILDERQGIAIIRFWNSEAMNDTEKVLHKIESILTSRLSLESGLPSPNARKAEDEGQKEYEWK